MSPTTIWVLSALHVTMGPTFDSRAIESYPSASACQAAVNAQIASHAQLAHAYGGYDYYRCDSWRGRIGGTGRP